MEDNWKEKIIESKLGGKKEWNDQERLELSQQLDKELTTHLNSLEHKNGSLVPTEDRWTESNWKEKIGEHPIFTPYLENAVDGEAPLSDLGEGLAQLKYAPEHNSPLEIAQNYKDEGVNHFKYKKYHFAIASFSEAIKANCPDSELNAQLYNNRAASHFFLKNYRSAIKDSEKAVELKPDYMKAIHRAIQCSTVLKSWDEVIDWCDKGLRIEATNDGFIKHRAAAVKEKKLTERDVRKNALKMKKQLEENSMLLSKIAERGVRIETSSTDNEYPQDDLHKILLQDLQPIHPTAKDSPVHLNSEGELVWPVVFLYPEYNESDCILHFNENTSFLDHLEAMFGPECPPAPFDAELKYTPKNLSMFYESSQKGRLESVSLSSSLKEVLSGRRYEVRNGTPVFVILVKNSTFFQKFIADYET